MDINGICHVIKDILQLDDGSSQSLGNESSLLASRMVEMSGTRLLEDHTNISVIQQMVPVITDILQSCKRNAIDSTQQCGVILLIVQVLMCTSNVVSDIQSLIDVIPSSAAVFESLRQENVLSKYIRALRSLNRCGYGQLQKIDYGLLISIIFDLNDKYSPEDKFEATMFMLEILQLPKFLFVEILSSLWDHEPAADLVLGDIFNTCGLKVESLEVESFSATASSVCYSNRALVDRSVIAFKPFQANTVHVCGLVLPTSRHEIQWTSPRLVHTPTTLSNMRKLAQAVLLNIPIVVQGQTGSGKSFLIRELAGLMGQADTLLELHLDDQTDSKALVGSYICSDIPGEFIWQPGLVTQAMVSGRWLLIEDIDRASLDVIATLTPLLEERKVTNGVHGKVEVHSSFRIFGTRSYAAEAGVQKKVGTRQRHNADTFTVPTMRHFTYAWHVVDIAKPQPHEIESILQHKHPNMIPAILRCLFRTYSRLNGELDSADGTEHTTRHTRKNILKVFTLRDLIKVADRIGRNHRLASAPATTFVTEKLRLDCLSEVVDVFLACLREKGLAYRDAVMDIATSGRHGSESVLFSGDSWNLSEEAIDAHLLGRTPTFDVSDSKLTIGRIDIDLSKPSNESSAVRMQQFAFSKHSLRLLETVAACVAMAEPVLLVGETGSGKTTSVQELASIMKHTLVVQNISLSTDSSDLLGGFRPVSLRQLFQPTYEQFVLLFRETFSQSQNSEYLQVASQYFLKEQWKKLLKAFQKAALNATKKLGIDTKVTLVDSSVTRSPQQKAWMNFLDCTKRLESNLPKILHGFAFAFVDGLMVDAMRRGYWVLLDEINLASPETLQGLVSILDGQSLCLTEKGDVKPVERHPDFRIFAAMNPPTDVGKRELPSSLRGRFTEIYVEEMTDRQDLQTVVKRYLVNGSPSDNALSSQMSGSVSDVVDVYLGCRAGAEDHLSDSAGQRPHYSLRSLTRALKACNAFMEIGFRPLTRALYEGFALSFQTQLDEKSRRFMQTFLMQCLQVKDGKSLMMPPSRPGGRKSTEADWVLVKPYWIRSGPLPPIDWACKDENGITRFVLTPTVEGNIRDLARAVCANVTSVLLQGPTSVGKTTMVEYLAARCGYRCIRINNHEHTDVQEYIGGYVTGNDGTLEFRYGVLVEALRNGDWIILDELNLAPSDVLEALNRLLDDNKELYIPETGEIIKPSPGFFLFATQNPAGVYGGRKPLSRAFRNRFIEIYIGDLPFNEVEEIVTASCGIPPKHGKMLVGVMKDMQMRRQQSNMLQGKYGSITTRDLIKWGKRHPANAEELVREGYMLLAEKHRSDTEKQEILDILCSVCKVQAFVPVGLYTPGDVTCSGGEHVRNSHLALQNLQELLRRNEVNVEGVSGLAITYSMCRLWTLASSCIAASEPALLIGETGSGKTTVCQLIAAERGQTIRIVNCHQSTETADIIGGLRPVRGRAMLMHNFVANIGRILELQAMVDVRFEREELTCCQGLVDASKKRVDIDQSGNTLHIDEHAAGRAIEELSSLFVKVQEQLLDSNAEPEGNDSPSVKRMKVGHTQNLSDDTIQTQDGTDLQSTKLIEIADLVGKCKILWQRYMALFEWQDGPLVEAMKNGDIFVLDEINLAEDAVIERLNSVLESSRTITLAEKGGTDNDQGESSSVVIVAHPNFRFFATMNPGDDYGKRELSPALRSRFTEIWVPGVNSDEDIILIVREMLPGVDSIANTSSSEVARAMVGFMRWIISESLAATMVGIKVSVREILAWAKFIVSWNCSSRADVYTAFVHGAQMLILDGLGIGHSMSKEQVATLKSIGIEYLISMCPVDLQNCVRTTVISPLVALNETHAVVSDPNKFSVGTFSIPSGPSFQPSDRSSYILEARSTVLNFQRVLRAMKLPRPILLEGPPGVGKTSLISNLARLSGHNLVRINLSEHSEISDLIGSDLPSVGTDSSEGDDAQKTQTSSAKFKWCDGVFLAALKRGDWVLLDELNLAPQSVLEGLNACFDHRGEVFIPEIGKSFTCPPSFRVFCAQNPMSEGGGRKGLPQSFLTRFSRVFVEPMTPDDMAQITSSAYQSQLSDRYLAFVDRMVAFVRKLQLDIGERNLYGRAGSPWEFNLRDVFRWCDLLRARSCVSDYLPSDKTCQYIVSHSAHMLFVSRLRSIEDRNRVISTFESVFGFSMDVDLSPTVHFVSSKEPIQGSRLSTCVIIGMERLFYNSGGFNLHVVRTGSTPSVHVLCHAYDSPLKGRLLNTLESVATCVHENWPVLLVGSVGSGKRRCVRHLAHLTGNLSNMVEFSVTPSTDATELLGSFEQANIYRNLSSGMELLDKLCSDMMFVVISNVGALGNEVKNPIEELYSMYSQTKSDMDSMIASNSISLHIDKQNNPQNIFRQIEKLLNMLRTVLQYVGSFYDVNSADALIDRAESIFVSCHEISNRLDNSGSFEWVDGVVVSALENGYWLLVNNVNLCSASVLDRLNSLLEPSGFLLLTESGEGRVVHPHKNFRIFFTMDPSYGDISRAMRNRCVELSILSCSRTSESTSGSPHDADIAVSQARSLISPLHPEHVITSLARVYDTIVTAQATSLSSNLPVQRLFARIVKLFQIESNTGIESEEAIRIAVHAVFPNLSTPHAAEAVRSSQRPDFIEQIFAVLDNASGILSGDAVASLGLIALTCARESVDMNDRGDWIVQWLLSNEERVVSRSVYHLRGECATSLVNNNKDRLKLIDKLRSVGSGEISMTKLRNISAGFLRRSILNCQSLFERCVLIGITRLVLESARSKDSTLESLRNVSNDSNSEWLNSILGDCSVTPSDAYLFSSSQSSTQLLLATARHTATLQRPLEAFQILQFLSQFREKSFHDRYLVLDSEANCARRVGSLVFGLSMANLDTESMHHAGLECLMDVAIAIDSSTSFLNDCREAKVLACLYAVIKSIDNLVRHVVGLMMEGHWYDDVMMQHPCLNSFFDTLMYRDILSKILLNSPPDIGKIPWNYVIVSLRWVSKNYSTFESLLRDRANSSSDRTAFESCILDAFIVVNASFGQCESAVALYFRKPVYINKTRLWKENGHAAVPVTKSDWDVRSSIFNIIEMHMGHSKLPSYVDPCFIRTRIDDSSALGIGEFDDANPTSEVTIHQSLRKNYVLMQEWLCLLSTFYWSHSNELPSLEAEQLQTRRAGASSVKYGSLIQGVTDIFQMGIANLKAEMLNAEVPVGAIANEPTPAHYMEAGEVTEVNDIDVDEFAIDIKVVDSASSSIIARELQCGGGILPTVAAEQDFIFNMLRINDMLAEISIQISPVMSAMAVEFIANTQDNFPDINVTLTKLLSLSRYTLQLGLQHTLFDPHLFRELQTLVWFLESLGKGLNRQMSADNLLILRKLTIAFCVAFDFKLYAFVSKNLSNNLLSVDTFWGSKTLRKFMTNPYHQEESGLGEYSIVAAADETVTIDIPDLMFTGIMRQSQPVCFELVMRLLHLPSLHLPMSSSGVVRGFGVHDTAELSVSACGMARKRLLYLFRMFVNSSNKKHNMGDFSRWNLIMHFTLAVVSSSRDFIRNDALVGLNGLMREWNNDSSAKYDVGKCSFFDALRNLQLHRYVDNPFVKKLFTGCLQPLLGILGSLQTVAGGANNILDLGRAWVYIGVLRAHLLVPVSPVDPSVKYTIKADIVSARTEAMALEYVSQKWHSSLISGPTLTPPMASLEDHFVLLEQKIGRWREQAIERPDDVLPFMNLFAELREACESLVSTDRLLGMIQSAEEATDAVLGTNWNDDSSADRAGKALDHLRQLASEEFSWQGTVDAFVSRLNKLFDCYEDVISPVVSALHNISQGLRLVISHSNFIADECFSNRHSFNVITAVEKAFESLFSFPSSINVSLVCNEAEKNVEERVVTSLAIMTSSASMLAARNDRMAAENSSRSRSVASVCTTKLMRLCRMDYYLTCQLISPHTIYKEYNDIMAKFVEEYHASATARKERELRKNSLYQYKDTPADGGADSKKNGNSDVTFESNDEKEEYESLMANFPNHLKVFEDITTGDMLSSAEDGKVTTDTEPAASVSGDIIDEDMIGTLIGIHARLMMLHMPDSLRHSRSLWRRVVQLPLEAVNIADGKNGKKSSRKRNKFVVISEDVRSAVGDFNDGLSAKIGMASDLQKHMFAYGVVGSKMIEHATKKSILPNADSSLKGFCLMTLHRIAQECNSSISADASAISWLAAYAKHFMSTGTEIDRDLLYLLDSQRGTPWNPISFHADPNTTQTILAAPYVRNMLKRAVDLLVMFPGNELLLNVCKISARISQFSIAEPLGKMLASVELLLRSAQDWEQYAAKHVSLEVPMKALSTLIRHWRGVELKSWAELLRCREVMYVNRAKKHWFSLFSVLNNLPDLTEADIPKEMLCAESFTSAKWKTLCEWSVHWLYRGDKTIVATVDASYKGHYNKRTESAGHRKKKKRKNYAELEEKEEKFDEAQYLLKIFDSLDGFLRSGVVGEFPARLHLLRLYSLELLQTSASSKYYSSSDDDSVVSSYKQVLRSKLANISYGVWQYYSQYLPATRNFQELLKGPIEKRLHDEIKISKWDHLNAYAVMEHSERVHRKLNKLIREYEGDVLEYPVSAVLRREVMGDLISENGELMPSTVIPTNDVIFPLGSNVYQYQSKEDGCFDDEESTHPEDNGGESSASSVKNEDEMVVADEDAGGNGGESNKTEDNKKTAVMIPYPDYIQVTDCSEAVLASVVINSSFDLAQVLEGYVIPATATRLLQSHKMFKKVSKYLNDIVIVRSIDITAVDSDDDALSRFKSKVRYGLQVCEVSSNICASIFYRVNLLRSQPDEVATRNVKHRAFGDLLARLKEEGISHLRSDAPVEARVPVEVFTINSLLSIEMAADIGNTLFHRKSIASSEDGRGLTASIDRGEHYFYRNVAELNQLRAQTMAPFSSDITSREVQIMLGQMENFFCVNLRTRCVLSAALQDIHGVMVAKDSIQCMLGEEFSDSEELFIASQKTIEDIWVYRQRAGRVLLTTFGEVSELAAAASVANSEGADVEWTKAHAVDDIIQRVPEHQVRRVGDRIARIISGVQVFLDVKSPSVLDGEEVSEHSTFVSDTGLNVVSSGNAAKLGMAFGMNDVLALYEATDELDNCYEEFMDSIGDITDMLSIDVVKPLTSQLRDFMDVIRSQKATLEAVMIGDGNGSDDTDANIDRFCVFVNTSLEHCLVSVQNLRCLSGVQGAPTTNADGNIVGSFGDCVHIPQANEKSASPTIASSLELCAASVEALRLCDLGDCLKSILSHVREMSSSGDALRGAHARLLNNIFHAVTPIIESIIATGMILVEDLISAYAESGKLMYVSLRMFRVLLAKGFCSDPTKEGGDGDGNDDISKMIFEDDVEGTGMGEGDGKKDVSDQIENEEQLLGLKNDKPEDKEEGKSKKQLDEEERDTGVEMIQDFDGDMFDMPDEKEQDDDEKPEEEEDEDLEREMGGELDKENIVDEKQWGDDEDEEDNPDGEEEFENDSKMQGETIEGEMTTKDEEEKTGGEKQDDIPAADAKDKPEDEGDDEEEEGNDERKINDEDQQMDKPLGVDVQKEEEGGIGDDMEGAEEEEEGESKGGEPDQEGEEPPKCDDLPDNLELDGEEGDENADEDDVPPELDIPENADDDAMSEAEEEDEEGKDEKDRNKPMSSGGGADPLNNEEEDDNSPSAGEDEQSDVEDENAPMDMKRPDNASKETTVGVQSKAGNDSVINTGEDVGDNDESGSGDEAEEHKPKKSTSGASSGDSSGKDSKAQNVDEDEPDASKGGKSSGNPSAGGKQSEGYDPTQDKTSERRRMEPPNPFRKLGDITERWHKRLNMDASTENEDNQEDVGDNSTNDKGAFEFEMKGENEEDDDQAGGAQVLAEASEQDAMQLPTQPEGEDRDGDMEDGGQEDADGMEDASARTTRGGDDSQREKRDRVDDESEDTTEEATERDAKKKRTLPKEDELSAADEDVEENDDFLDKCNESDGDGDKEKKHKDDEGYSGGKVVPNMESWMAKNQTGDSADDEKHRQQFPESDSDDDSLYLEEANACTPDSECRLVEAREKWALLSAQYQSICIRLCEQLRLVLEPTLASRLQGDYRTGKRISMRRVIGYVASGFRKDKIWLRRTKPSKREYQVMLMIDDSSSMGEAGPLAMASLSVISGALTRLEVGDVAVCSFAEKVTTLHNFGEPFSDQSGAKVLSKFNFSATQTRLASALQSVLPIFEEARLSSSSSAAVTLQICFVISDAKIDSDNRDRLNSIVREMAEKHILAVLIIIDKNDNSKDSIFETKSVEFTPSGIVTKRYMDDFPFPYYVAINHVDALPEVLADALKQWFELVSSQLDN